MLLILLCSGFVSMGQTNLEVFGQNRLQYRRFDWKFYDAEHFKIYHYDRSGREVARYVAEQAEQDVAAIERRLGGLFPEKLNIILYNSFDDYQQSNIGLNSELQVQSDNPAGQVKLVGDKLIIYFTGTHADLKKQLRRGMSQVVMERLMFGENVMEMVKNAVLMDLPPYITKGYVDYVVDGWSSEDDNRWKNILLSKPKIYFNDIALADPDLGGKAFWKYIAVKNGENNVKNLLYLTQSKSSLNKALQLTVHMKLKQVSDSLIQYYKNRYAFEEQIFQPIDTTSKLTTIAVPNDEGYIKNMIVSPRGGDVAYVKWRYGEYQVILEKTKLVNGVDKRESSVLLSGGVKNYNEKENDPDYPLLSWNNTGFKLGIIFKNRDRLRLRVYNSVKGKIEAFKVPKNRFERITGFTFMEDDDEIILSAIKAGQSDLFEYRLKRGVTTQLTDDAWDDMAPTFVSGGARKGVVFLSNRPQPFLNIKPLPNELPIGGMNAFFYNATTKSYDLLQLTNNKKGNLTQAIPYGPDHFAYLSDQSGVYNRYVVMFGRNTLNQDSAYSLPMTNFGRSILYQQYNPASGKIADIIQVQDKYQVLFHKIELPAPDGNAPVAKPAIVSFVDGVVKRKNSAGFTNPLNLSSKDDNVKEVDPFKVKSGSEFQTEFVGRSGSGSNDSAKVKSGPESEKLAEMLALRNGADSTVLTNKNGTLANGIKPVTGNTPETDGALNGRRILYVDSTFIQLRSKKYYLTFKPDFFGVRADNSVIFNRYQPYGGSGGEFANPTIAGMLTGSISDKMEDYRLTAGLRIPANFSGYTTYLQFENFRRRTDWAIIYLRQENKSTQGYSLNGPSSPVFAEPTKSVTNLVQGSVSYPIDKVKSVRLDFGVRQDRMVVKAIDQVGLLLPTSQTYWVQSRAEFVYDDTRNPTMNIYNGIRYKFYSEYMYRAYTDNKYGFSNNGDDDGKAKYLYSFGTDFRIYQKIHKNFIFALRFAGAHSGGSQKIMYYLGGEDNVISPQVDGALQPSGKNNYAFQTLATNLRGYAQNARNGNNYALVNAELRLPLITTFTHNAVQSSILKNLQLVAFGDAGTAWEGFLPNAAAFDRFYHVTWNGGTATSITANIPNFANSGLAVGYGAGLRTLLFGYFLRGDWSRNIDGQTRLYFSLGLDF